MEEERRINWLSLLIKVIIIFIFALIIIWIVSKIVGKKEPSDAFKSNLDNMEKVSLEYFKTIDLPEENGKSIKITLGEMIEKKLIVSDNKESNNSCDKEKSYAKITRDKDNYIVDVTLKCGKEEDTKTSKFSFKDCRNCNTTTDNQSADNSQNATNDNQNVDSNSSGQNSNTIASGTMYYEYIKENISYSKWMRGSKTGENIENKYEYCSTAKQTYYTIGYLTKKDIEKNNSMSYTIKLNNVPNKDYYFTIVSDSSNFKESEISNYLDQNSAIVNKNSIKLENKDIILNYYLEDNNFTYKLSPYYRKGSFYVDVNIVIKNKDNIKYYHDNSSNKDIAIIPLKIDIKFASNEIVETKPSGYYDIISYYRYIEKTKDIVWSTETSLDGYTKTGNTKVQ